MITCDRKHFIDCVNGDLMIRNAKTVITHLGDAATFAVDAHERGSEITLTINGKPFSKIKDGIETKIE